MTRSLRIIDTGLNTARRNTALSAALLDSCGNDQRADILRFYRFPNSVLLGASQPAAGAMSLDRCRHAHIEAARRITGGGAVYMCPSMLAWDFVTQRSASNADLSEAIGKSIAGGLQRLHIAVAFTPPNSLTVDGRKISGAATAATNRTFLHQGTLLLRDELAAMAQALGIPIDVLRPHVTSVEETCSNPPAIEQIRQAIGDNLARAFGLSQVTSAISCHEQAVADREFAKELGLDTFVSGDDWRLPAGVSA